MTRARLDGGGASLVVNAAQRLAVGGIRRRRATAIVALALSLACASLVSLGSGAVEIPAVDVLGILSARVAGAPVPDTMFEAVLVGIRLPRVLLGAAVGAGLALAGTLLQGLFRNPLADPGLVGVSWGATAGAALTIYFAGSLGRVVAFVPPVLVTPIGAFGGALLATTVVYRGATREGRTSMATMLLLGIAVNALALALIGLLTFLSDDIQLRSISLWRLGGLGASTWTSVTVVGSALAITVIGLHGTATRLNALLLGETEARHLGLDVRRLRRRAILLSTLVVAVGVSFTGPIGFIGLVVPHAIRMIGGPDHRLLLPAAALSGAALLVVADVVARTIAIPAELPVGVLTALIGVPFFAFVLLSRRETVAFS